ncbi:Ger(x)C family spore germination protein [Bacillus sp. UNC438CL73TsuS30]|uniref:Ger(x)C family spore germination protein n=1 Tax=Bacillus sp. UNC438CL73TsuS30 TaxID=1340434 RepID=UPI00047CA096|nr:Ger(x)C family spore germination protein [Bacillus sp. UNC438CL73TsuS30]
MFKASKMELLLAILLCFSFISGCAERKQLEKLALITAAGYDLDKKNVIKGTVVVHKFDPMAQNITKVISADSHTSKGLMKKQNLMSNQKLVSGQMRCVVYSRMLAEKGVIQLVDALNRDSTVGNMVYLTVADGKASSIINLDETNQQVNLGTYLYNIIKQNVEGEQILSPTLQEFNHNYYDIGKDPVLPIMKLKDKDVIISGIALFRDDQLVAELDPSKIFYLKVLADKYNAGSQELGFNRDQFKQFRLKTGEHATRTVYNKLFIDIDNIRSHSKIKLVDKKSLRFKVEVKLSSRLLETTEPIDFSNPAAVKFIEKEINKKMKKEIGGFLAYLQKLDVDPVGFGNEYETHLRGKQLSKKEWRRLFKRATFDIHVKNTIVKTGVID